jgi:beta-galactosidase
MRKRGESMSMNLTRRDALKGIAALSVIPLFPSFAFASAGERGSVATTDFDDGWLFHRGDAAGAQESGFDASAWRKVDLPHDWSIEDLSTQSATNGSEAIWQDCNCPETVGPFSRMKSEGKDATGWVVGGIGWYRKSFSTPRLPQAGRAILLFDGVYRNSELWVNGTEVGKHPYGYTAFYFDITDLLHEKGDNILAVKVSNEGRNSRWYSGSGIDRHVFLMTTGRVSIPVWGVHVQSSDISNAGATISIAVQLANHDSNAVTATVSCKLLDEHGQVAATLSAERHLDAKGKGEALMVTKVSQPQLWSPKTPSLYKAEVEVSCSGAVVDRSITSFGVREIKVDAEHGLRINGESYKLKGACVHHDNGPLGSAAIDRAEERRVELLKANGYNAIRCSHNPPSSVFLDACDRLGVMVIDEAFDMWEQPKSPDDYHLDFKEWWNRDIDAMVFRDRKHPSVIMWSIGNEISERSDPDGVRIAKDLSSRVRELDKSRPITMAVPFFFDATKPRPWSDTDAAYQFLDVCGYNYTKDHYESDHQLHPSRVMMGTESFPVQVAENWELVNQHSYVIGDFVWTGIDYIGESGLGAAVLAPEKNPFGPPAAAATGVDAAAATQISLPKNSTFAKPGFPWFLSYCGDIDLIGNKKAPSYLRDVVWDRSPLEMAVLRPLPPNRKEQIMLWGFYDELRSWTWPGDEGTPVTVRVYSKAEKVNLTLDGKPIEAAKAEFPAPFVTEFALPYAPGELKASAIVNGKLVEQVLRTTGNPSRIMLHADRAHIRTSRNDLSYVMAELQDDAGNPIEDGVAEIQFSVKGPGELAAVGSANPHEMASYRQSHRRTFHGRCLAILRPTGEKGTITLEARGDNLRSADITIDVS